jgi:hypothetical protein
VNDAVSPRLSVRVRRRPATRRLLARGLVVRARCSERCRLRLVLRRHGRTLSVPLRVSLAAGVTRRVVVRPNRAGRLRLRRHASLPLTLVARAVDTAGNRRTLRIGLRATR